MSNTANACENVSSLNEQIFAMSILIIYMIFDD